MNQHLQEFARNFIKERLKQLPAEQQLIFNRMYAHKNLDRSVNEAVDAMPADKLDWAMQQVERSYSDGIAAGTVQAFTVAGASPSEDGWREFVTAVSEGFASEHQGQLHCDHCRVNLEHTPVHEADCMMLRAKAYLATHPADGIGLKPNFDAARKFLQLYGNPRPGYDTTVSGMVEHLRKEGHSTAFPAWAYSTGGILQPEQALQWLAHLFAVEPVSTNASAGETAPETSEEPLPVAPPGFTWRCSDCYGPLGEDHSDNCGIGRGLITREDVGDSPIPNRAD